MDTAAQGGGLGCLDQQVCIWRGRWEGRGSTGGLEAMRSLSRSVGVVVSSSSSSSSLPSVLWEPLTISVMLAAPGVLGAEGLCGAPGVAGDHVTVVSINPLPRAVLTVSQGGQQMPGDTEP